jgi:hypothetical protein
MPKVTYSPGRGLVQETGSGFEVSGVPVTQNQEQLSVSVGDTATLKSYGVSRLTTVGGTSGTITLPDGDLAGQMKTVVLDVDGGKAVLSVTNHVTSSPEVFEGEDAKDILVLVWNGTKWGTAHNTGWAT